MSSDLVVELPLSQIQKFRLLELQGLFSDACNSITPLVRKAQCWNRVALHHMVYRQIRESYPSLGSQMSCNVIYSVCRAARAVYQSSNSPWGLGSHAYEKLPLIRFRATAPVYFDRHTLSLRSGLLSLFTLDGRMRVAVDLAPDFEARFQAGDLREIALIRSAKGFQLFFTFSGGRADGEDISIPGHLIIEDPSIEVIGERQSSEIMSGGARQGLRR
jgi:hypothetical protein